MKQTIRMMHLKISGDAFRTESPFINGKIVTRLNTDNMVPLHKKIHAALYSAVRTMRRHNFVYHSICSPSTIRCIVQMRSVFVDDLIEMFDFAHEFSDVL